MQNRVFFPQAALDQWIVGGTVDLQKGELTLLGEGRRYALEEAVHVLREVSGAGDAAKLIGLVKTRTWLEQQGAEIVESSMLFGDAAYDVEPGWVGTPVGSLAAHVASTAGKRARGGKGAAPGTEEELLAGFVTKNS